MTKIAITFTLLIAACSTEPRVPTVDAGAPSCATLCGSAALYCTRAGACSCQTADGPVACESGENRLIDASSAP